MNHAPEPLEATPTLKRRLARYLAKVAWRNLPFALVAVLVMVGLAKVGLDHYPVIHGLLLASPFMLAALLAFVVHAWRQNTPVVSGPEPGQDAEPAEPGQVGQPVGQGVVSQPQATVRVVNVTSLRDRTRPEELASQPLPRAVGAEQPTAALRINPEYLEWEEANRGDE